MPTFEPESRQFTATFPDSTKPHSSQWGLPEWFAVAQVAGPALLYLPGSQAFRVPLRVGVFALSLMGLVWCLRRSRLTRVHPSWILLVIAAVYMVVMIFHPATNTMMAGLAQIGMHLAVAAPLFWAPRYFLGDYRRLLRVLTILWVLNGASVLVGILQVRDPGTWMPAEFSSVVEEPETRVIAMYQYRAADGSMAIRPPGLGDSSGGRVRCRHVRGHCRARLPGTACIAIEKTARVRDGHGGSRRHLSEPRPQCAGRGRRLCGRLFDHHGGAGTLENRIDARVIDGVSAAFVHYFMRNVWREKHHRPIRHAARGRSHDGLRKIRAFGHGGRCFRYAPRRTSARCRPGSVGNDAEVLWKRE